MAMNTSKVLTGGVAAGVVLAIVDFVMNMFIFGDRMIAEANAFKAGLGDQMMEGGWLPYVVMDLVIGIALVWTYAAIRPRFGPGFKTAAYAALLFWVLSAIMYSGYMMMGMMSTGLFWMGAISWLAGLLLAAGVGGWLYSEEGAVTAA